MEIKSYLDDLEGVECAPESRNMKVLADGRRVQENVQTVILDDGTEEQTYEILEEVVPMRVAKRVQRKLVKVPVEERVECVAEDGGVTTHVRAIDPSLLELDREPESLEQLARDVRCLHAAVLAEPRRAVPVTKKSVVRKKRRSFWEKASARYGRGQRRAADEELVEVPEVIEEEEEVVVVVKHGRMAEFGLTTLAWIAFAVVAGLVTYALI
jgi:hypothetical protein